MLILILQCPHTTPTPPAHVYLVARPPQGYVRSAVSHYTQETLHVNHIQDKEIMPSGAGPSESTPAIPFYLSRMLESWIKCGAMLSEHNPRKSYAF